MKAYVLFSLLLCSVNLLAAEDCGEVQMPESIQSVDDILNHLEGSTDPRLQYKDCSETEISLLNQSVSEAGRMIARLSSQLQMTTRDPAVERNLEQARNKLNCIHQRFQTATMTCKDLDGSWGRAIPFIGSGFAIDPASINASFERFHSAYASAQVTMVDLTASTIIHELSHKCGTNDNDYFQWWNDPMTSAGRNWANTADTYQSWALWGFCIPGPNCASRTNRTRLR